MIAPQAEREAPVVQPAAPARTVLVVAVAAVPQVVRAEPVAQALVMFRPAIVR
jgi:hypothetical protein